MPQRPISILSLFCGAGGLDHGFRNAHFKTIFACDNFEAAVQSFNFNAKRDVAQLADLSSVEPKTLLKTIRNSIADETPEGLIGGPPCQGFSRGNASADPNDPRNLLPFRYADILSYFNTKYRLKFFVFENVMGLQQQKHFVRFRAIQQAFTDAGFRLFQQDLDAQDFGVPQLRRRLFVVGLNAKLFPKAEFVFPKGTAEKTTVRDAIHGLPEASFFERGLTPRDISFHPNHWTMRPKSPKLAEGASPSGGRSFRRLEWDKASPTIAYGNREIHVHPDGKRRLTVLEAMLLQGFPRTFRLLGNLSQQVTQVSNAVPPPLATAIAKSIRQLLLAGGKNGRRD